MPISRRRFLARSAAAAAALPLASPHALLRPGARARRASFEPIRRGVGAYAGQGGTIGYLRSESALAAVDAQFPDSARAFLAGLRERAGDAGRGLDLLVNTHHHGDHTAGNAVLAPVADRHVAHEAVPGLQRAAAVRYDALGSQRYPTETFRRSWSVDLGDEVVSLLHVEPAHTAGDAVVHFERADVVHMGDLVFNRVHPFVDLAAGASTAGWSRTLQAVHDRFSDATAFVFGHANAAHGVVGTRADLLVMRDYLDGVRAYAAAALAEGRTAEELGAVEAAIPGFEAFDGDGWSLSQGHVLGAVAEELSR